ncbi:WD40 repeat domain-containing protein [Enhygromyxa salina]|uniref:WD domain, G-beta repeat n=1 Tax=Enhygromyxa salina TaxID=215803 RepID=A0A2S9XTN4_9BACT|nr:hypothetical protein [Enhygromyxa salina]PRP96090.1 hypothetical protein ENSA7_69040 [Enhygromyxa salina]
MTARVGKTALSLAWTLAACHRGAPVAAEPPPPGPVAEIDGPSVELPIVIVPQSTATEISSWLFEPGGRRLASTELGECTIWDIESGRLIRTLEGDAEPCQAWLPAVDFFEFVGGDDSADGRLTLDTSAGVTIVDAETGRKLRDLPCPDCATVDDITWSSEDHQLALVWRDTARLEIWDADAATLVRAESIPITGELEELELGWTRAGATVGWTEIGFPIECDHYESYYTYDCEWDEVEQVETRRPITQQMMSVDPNPATAINKIDAIDTARSDAEVYFDPDFRWMIWMSKYSERRSGTTTTLHFAGLGDLDSKMGSETFDDYNEYGESLFRYGEWRTDGATHWAVSISHEDYDGAAGMVEWETTLTSPPLGRRSHVILESVDYDSTVDVQVYGFVGDALRVNGQICGDMCTPLTTPLPPDCDLLDIGSGHGAELLECETLVLRRAGATTRLPIATTGLSWWWSRDGALALYDDSKFMVVDAVLGNHKQPRTDVLGVYDGRLGPELERLVLDTKAGFEVIDLGTGEPILRVPDVTPDAAALSPTGDRLAMLDNGQVQILALPSGEPIVSWASDGFELAFRQDGRAIFIGDGQPELSFDADTGKPLTDPALGRITATIDHGGEIDPSWRWIMDDERGELTRTLDGRVLTFREGGAWLTDTGQYQGPAPGPEVAFRVGNDNWAVPEFDAEQLAKWLEQPDLVEAFAAGRAIAKPEMSTAALAGVRARVQRPGN